MIAVSSVVQLASVEKTSFRGECYIPWDCSTCFFAGLDKSRASWEEVSELAKCNHGTMNYLQLILSCRLNNPVSKDRTIYPRLDVVPMVSSTSAARGVVVAKDRARGTRRDRAAARKSCGRMIERRSMRGRERGWENWRVEWRGRVDGKEEGAVLTGFESALGYIMKC